MEIAMYSTRAIMRQVTKCPQKSLYFRAACTVFNFNTILDTTIVCQHLMPFMAKADFWKLRIQACFLTTDLTVYFWHLVNLNLYSILLIVSASAQKFPKGDDGRMIGVVKQVMVMKKNIFFMLLPLLCGAILMLVPNQGGFLYRWQD